MRALVTGGAGFIGSNLVDALAGARRRGDVLDNLSTGRRENIDGALARGAELVEADIRDGAAVRDVVERVRPEVVFHLAAQIDVRKSAADPAFDARVNVVGTINVLEAARAAGVRPVRQHLDRRRDLRRGPDHPRARGPPVAPEAPYGQSKFCAEGYCDLYSPPARPLHGLAALRQRLRPAPGPARRGRRDRDLLRQAARRASRRRSSATASRRATTSTWATWSRANLAAAESRRQRRLQRRARRADVACSTSSRRCAQISGQDGFEPEFAPPRAGEVQHIALDAARATGELGWEPQITLRDGLERTLTSLR